MNTLKYYATQEVLLCFQELLVDGPAELQENYQAGADYVKEEFTSSCRWPMSNNATACRYLFAWLQPVLHLFNLEDFKFPDTAATMKRSGAPSLALDSTITVDEMISELADPDGFWANKMDKCRRPDDWAWLPESEAMRLVQFLAAHEDPNLRELACSFAGCRHFSDLLFGLLHDRTARVQKSAAYYSRMIGAERRFEHRLWQLLMKPRTRGCFATETLESYLVHTSDPLIYARLQALVLADERPSIQVAALSALHERTARTEIDSVKQLLQEPAFNNWALHISLLDACAEMRIPVKIDHLLSVDDVYLQVALAQYQAAANQ